MKIKSQHINRAIATLSGYLDQAKASKHPTHIVCRCADLQRIKAFLEKYQKPTPAKKKKPDISLIVNEYHEKVHALRIWHGKKWVSDKAQARILKRLELFSEKELCRAIDNFSKEKWWMEHNSRRGLVWFFWSDDRIDQFLMLSPLEKVDPAILKLQKILKGKNGG